MGFQLSRMIGYKVDSRIISRSILLLLLVAAGLWLGIVARGKGLEPARLGGFVSRSPHGPDRADRLPVVLRCRQSRSRLSLRRPALLFWAPLLVLTYLARSIAYPTWVLAMIHLPAWLILYPAVARAHSSGSRQACLADTLSKSIIPALNEEQSIGRVLDDLPDWIDEVIVVDNGSTDRTAEIAAAHGARVVHEPRPGLRTGLPHWRGSGGKARTSCCSLTRTTATTRKRPASWSRPIAEDEFDLVIGSRVRGSRTRGALTVQQRFGNWLACRLIALFWGYRYTDLGPFRAVRSTVLEALEMQDRGYGWTTEMQIRAARDGYRILEVPVSYRPRIGHRRSPEPCAECSGRDPKSC